LAGETYAFPFTNQAEVLANAGDEIIATSGNFSLCERKKWEEAGILAHRLAPLGRIIVARDGVPGVKAALEAAGYFGGAPRPRLQELEEHARKEFAKPSCAAESHCGTSGRAPKQRKKKNHGLHGFRGFF
jgi:hypothetical protein